MNTLPDPNDTSTATQTIPYEVEEPSFYAAMAAAFRRIADAFDELSTQDLPAPRKPYVSIDIQPHGEDDEATIALVNAWATALFGQRGEATQMDSGRCHHLARGRVGPVSVGVYDRIENPAEREAREEKARLRAELDELRRERDELAAAHVEYRREDPAVPGAPPSGWSVTGRPSTGDGAL